MPKKCRRYLFVFDLLSFISLSFLLYSCIYHRDMSIINIDKSNIAKAHLDEAKKEHDMLKIIAPNIPLTKILEADLKSLSSKID